MAKWMETLLRAKFPTSKWWLIVGKQLKNLIFPQHADTKLGTDPAVRRFLRVLR